MDTQTTETDQARPRTKTLSLASSDLSLATLFGVTILTAVF